MRMRTLKVREGKKHSSCPYDSVLQDTALKSPLPEGHDWTATLPKGPTLPLDCGLLEGRVQSNSLCPQWPTQVPAQSLYSPNVCWICEDGAETFSGSNQRHVFNTAFQSTGVWDEPHTWGDCATAGGEPGRGPQRITGELGNISFLKLTHKFLPYIECFVIFNVFTPLQLGGAEL